MSFRSPNAFNIEFHSHNQTERFIFAKLPHEKMTSHSREARNVESSSKANKSARHVHERFTSASSYR